MISNSDGVTLAGVGNLVQGIRLFPSPTRRHANHAGTGEWAKPVGIGVTFRLRKAVSLYSVARGKQTAGIAGHHNARSLVQQRLHRFTRSIYVSQEGISENHSRMFVDTIFDLRQGVALSLHLVA